MPTERITKSEAKKRGYRQNCNGEWLRRRAPGHPTDDKEYFIGEEVMTDIEAELLDALVNLLRMWEGEPDCQLTAKARYAIVKARGE